jgi:hypothetical protein
MEKKKAKKVTIEELLKRIEALENRYPICTQPHYPSCPYPHWQPTPNTYPPSYPANYPYTTC